MLFFQKKYFVFLCFIISFLCLLPITTIKSTGDLATALSLLKTKLLSLATQLNHEETTIEPNKTEEADPLLTYEDITKLTTDQMKTFYDFYFDEITYDPDVENLKNEAEKGKYNIKKIKSLRQIQNLCGWFSAFNGTEMYKAAEKNNGDVPDDLLTRKADTQPTQEEKNTLATLFNELKDPYSGYKKDDPTEFDVWLMRRLSDLRSLSTEQIKTLNGDPKYPEIPYLKTLVEEKSSLTSTWLGSSEVSLLTLFSLNLFKKFCNDGCLNKSDSSMLPLRHIKQYFPYFINDREDAVSTPHPKFIKEFRQTGKPILFLFNRSNNHYYTCVITKKGIFFADSLYPKDQNTFKKLYDYVVGNETQKLSTLNKLTKTFIDRYSYFCEDKDEPNKKRKINDFLWDFDPRKSDLKRFLKAKPELFKTKEK